MNQFSRLRRLMRQGLDQGVFPGASAAIFHGEDCVHEDACGVRWLGGPAVDGETRFDLASLTKILATLPALLLLAGLRELSLDDRVTRFWPAFGARGKGDLTLRMLLAHASGLPAWRPFFLDVLRQPTARCLTRGRSARSCQEVALAVASGRAAVLAGIEASGIERPPWTSALYSDLGFIALGNVVERVSGTRLDAFVRDEVHARLSLDEPLGFFPLDAADPTGGVPAPNIAATGLFRPREPAAGQEAMVPAPPIAEAGAPSLGEVDDDNAFVMGGVAGHAGLFGTARGVGLFAERVLEELLGAHRIAPVELWRETCQRDARTPGSTRALGFDTPSPQGSSAGVAIAASRAVGHTGFTGTSLWIDLDRQLAIALLTNRVHPRRGNEAIRDFRPRFCDEAVAAIGDADE